ncbi:MAG: hypothetical protein K0Q51_356 [Rickettsiaceae bacterium]|jgi:hypothetical protein|nr:hypothetical protein [Rickettsiaceae bacterium]
MDTKLENPNAVTIELFKTVLNDKFINVVNSKILQTLANMLALYYAGSPGLKEAYNEQAFIEKSAENLTIYLVGKSFEDYSFSITLTLFATAIADDDTYTEDKSNNLNQSNDILKDYLGEILDPNISDVKYIKEQVGEILAAPGNNEDKVQFILDNKDKIIKGDKTLTTYTHAPELSDANQLQDKNTNRLIGSSLAVGLSTAIAASFLGPVALVAALPIAYFGLSFGGKAVDQAEKMLKEKPGTSAYLSDQQALNDFNKILQIKLKKAQEKERSVLKNQEDLVKQANLDKVKGQAAVDNIIGTLTQAKSTVEGSKTALPNALSAQEKKGRNL